MREFLLLLRNELEKSIRSRTAWLGVVAIVTICLIVFYSTATFATGTLNAWGYLDIAMQSVFTDAGLIFIVIFSCMLTADEFSSGTIRLLLTAPVGRFPVYTAKAVTGLLYMTVLLFSAMALALALGAWRYGLRPVGDDFGVIFSLGEVLRNLFIAVGLTWLPLAAVVCYGIAVGAMTRRTGPAIAFAVGLLLLVETLRQFISGMAPWICTTYTVIPWTIFHDIAQGVDYHWNKEEIERLYILSLTYAAVFFFWGAIIFHRRDLTA